MSPDTRADCSKLDFSYSREMTLDPLRSGHIRERRRIQKQEEVEKKKRVRRRMRNDVGDVGREEAVMGSEKSKERTLEKKRGEVGERDTGGGEDVIIQK